MCGDWPPALLDKQTSSDSLIYRVAALLVASPLCTKVQTEFCRGKGKSSMKKIYILGFALSVVFAFSVISAASALAEDEFLFNAEKIGGTEESLPAETTGEILLELMPSGIDLLCSLLSMAMWVLEVIR
jgi:hypothetical protein